MKQFAVLKKIGDFDATVVREFDDKQPWVALAFANALQDTEEKSYIKYYVAEVHTVEQWRGECDKRFSCCQCASDPVPAE